jgi:alpha-muurolene/germacrene-A/gamma-muurolene/(+)-delta-cadinol synthase
MGLFFKAVESEARSRETGFIFDINSYVVHRRDNSGCRPGFDLLEYTLGIDLPDFVIKNDVFRGLSQCANDFVALSNVCNLSHHNFLHHII